MSLSQERPTNPAGLFMKVKSGTIVYYDKEKQENIEVPTPFEFIVLDQLATVKGWSDADESGFWSNEVRSVGRDNLTIRTSKGIRGSGIWRDIKGEPNLAGAKYTASIYIAHKAKNGLVISNLGFTGAALNAWIEFTQKHRVNKIKVVLSSWEDAKKGSVKYKVPVFEAIDLEDKEKAEAIELDKQLQAYFNEYFNYVPEGSAFSAHVDDVLPEDDEITDEPIDMSEIPF